MEEEIDLFTRANNAAVLNKFKVQLDEIHPENGFEKDRNGHIKTIIGSMAGDPLQWDKHCQINIGWIGNHFISLLSEGTGDLSKSKLDDIYSYCFRFLFELYLSIKEDLSIDFEKARRFAFHNIDKFEQNAKEQIEFAIHQMPISIFKVIANSDSIKSIKDFNETALHAVSMKDEWDKDLTEREKRIQTLKSELSKYQTGFNFVGLFQGFEELSIDKKNEKDGILFWLRLIGIIILAPLVAELITLYLNLHSIDKIRDLLLLSIVPTVSLVAILIYYFRVLLYNYKSAKSQLLQIELRKTLCRFIQHYADYAAKMKEKDKESLSKFENIVFSGIVTEDEKLPSTYDGVEQLSNLIKSIRS